MARRTNPKIQLKHKKGKKNYKSKKKAWEKLEEKLKDVYLFYKAKKELEKGEQLSREAGKKKRKKLEEKKKETEDKKEKAIEKEKKMKLEDLEEVIGGEEEEKIQEKIEEIGIEGASMTRGRETAERKLEEAVKEYEELKNKLGIKKIEFRKGKKKEKKEKEDKEPEKTRKKVKKKKKPKKKKPKKEKKEEKEESFWDKLIPWS